MSSDQRPETQLGMQYNIAWRIFVLYWVHTYTCINAHTVYYSRKTIDGFKSSSRGNGVFFQEQKCSLPYSDETTVVLQGSDF